ncbi:hypothetical protein [Maribacter sp. 2308TA10-17]|uniref:hypothetical protein n=1 Tax=Maribacter sp. 2308TA10-17 TaxID=3386276 RepID=UPI0039BC7953
MSVVTYPAEVTGYSLLFSENNVKLQLTGKEKSNSEQGDSQSEKNIAKIDFISEPSGDSKNFKAFINRGGFLNVSRPLYMLSAMLVVLEQGGKILLDGNGNLSKKSKVLTAIH